MEKLADTFHLQGTARHLRASSSKVYWWCKISSSGNEVPCFGWLMIDSGSSLSLFSHQANTWNNPSILSVEKKHDQILVEVESNHEHLNKSSNSFSTLMHTEMYVAKYRLYTWSSSIYLFYKLITCMVSVSFALPDNMRSPITGIQ